MNTQYVRDENKSVPISSKLRALFELQNVVSEIDKFKTLRGELPLEVQDLEDEITGLKTRCKQFRRRHQRSGNSDPQQKNCH